jgi:hypothetical protein
MFYDMHVFGVFNGISFFLPLLMVQLVLYTCRCDIVSCMSALNCCVIIMQGVVWMAFS